MYLDSENWLKASMEYENDKIQRLGSVVTNNGYSDWSSMDGVHFKQMRNCHMFNVKETIQFGIYACSAEDSSFKATFTNMEVTECKWLAHDGQQPDVE